MRTRLFVIGEPTTLIGKEPWPAIATLNLSESVGICRNLSLPPASGLLPVSSCMRFPSPTSLYAYATWRFSVWSPRVWRYRLNPEHEGTLKKIPERTVTCCGLFCPVGLTALNTESRKLRIENLKSQKLRIEKPKIRLLADSQLLLNLLAALEVLKNTRIIINNNSKFK